MIHLVLPYPVSANRYWRTYSLGKVRHVITLSAEAVAYKKEVATIAAGRGLRVPYEGRVHVNLWLYPHRPKDWEKRYAADPIHWEDSVRCLDLDNARKVVYDSLIGIAYIDDKQIWGDTATRMTPDGVGRVEINISRIQ